MKLSDALTGAFLIALAIAILFHIQSYPLIPGQNYGPALFPGVIAVGFIGCGILLMVRGVRAKVPLVTLSDWVRNPVTLTNFVVVCAVLLLYIVLAEPLGFLLTAPLCLVLLFLKLKVRLPMALVVAIAAALVMHFLFYKLLRVPLPWGVLERFAW
jgi:putative tricarboxylic transport membrane protein